MLGSVRLRLILVVIVLASAGLVTQASASPTGSIPVVRCPTKFGAQGTSGKSPASLAVLGHPSSIHGLAAYTNFEEFLVAPAGMKCSGEVGVTGTGASACGPRVTDLPRSTRITRASLSHSIRPARRAGLPTRARSFPSLPRVCRSHARRTPFPHMSRPTTSQLIPRCLRIPPASRATAGRAAAPTQQTGSSASTSTRTRPCTAPPARFRSQNTGSAP